MERHQAGFSPIEVLVALVIGLVLTATVLQVYIANKQTYRVGEASARLQENARFASELIARDARMSGYQGCAGNERTTLNQLQDSAAFLYDFETVVQGFDATGTDTWAPTLDASISNVLSGNDILVIRGLFGGETAITGSADTGNCGTAALILADSDGFAAGDIVVAGNCNTASLFQISGISDTSVTHYAGGSSPGNAGANLGACFAGDGWLGRLSTRIFFVGQNDAGVPALYRTEVSGANTSHRGAHRRHRRDAGPVRDRYRC